MSCGIEAPWQGWDCCGTISKAVPRIVVGTPAGTDLDRCKGALDVIPDPIAGAGGSGPAARRCRLSGLRPEGKPAPEEQTGLKVGAEAPKFTLKDQEDKERSLDELLKKGKVALVFFRSADW